MVHPTTSVVIPQDIIESIIEAVGDDTRSLKRCSLVSSEFLLPSRKRLFSRISLRGYGDERLHQVLVENPVLQTFVRTIDMGLDLDYDYDFDFDFDFPSLISILRLPFCFLESFIINIQVEEPEVRLDWNVLSSELKDALSTITHSSTLKTLHITRINVPITLFQGIHLAKLVLHSVLPQFDLGGKSLASEEGEVATTAPHGVIDQIVWRIYEPAYWNDLPDPMFLPFMSHLRVLEIHANPHSSTMGYFNILTYLILSLHLSSSPALEHLKFSITISVDEEMLDNDSFYDDLDSDGVWGCLNSITTHPTGSRLQRVDIEILFCYDDGDIVVASDDVLEDILEQLPLLQEKGILFVRRPQSLV